MSIVKVDQKKITNFEDLQRHGVKDASFDIVPLERGNWDGTMTRLWGPVVSVSTGRFLRGFRACGVQSETRWTLAYNAAPVLLRGFEVRPGDLFLLAPGQEIYASYLRANAYVVILIEEDVLFAYLESRQTGASDAKIWKQPASVVRVNPKSAAVRAEAFRKLVEALSVDGPTMAAETVERYRYKILDLALAPVFDSFNQSPQMPLAAADLVRRVDRYFGESGDRPSISELCERFKVPRRSLFNHFDDVLGLPPLKFQSYKRLCEVHMELSKGSPDLFVQDVAIAHGFLQLGKFSGDYGELFDERPKQTLQNAQRQRQLASGFCSAITSEMPLPLGTVIPQ